MRVQKLEEKTFTIDNYLADDSPFKIAIEFEENDEEIRDYLRSEGRSDFFLELGPFSGYVSIKLRDQEIGEPSNYTYPAQHFAWLTKCSKVFLQKDPPEIAGLSSREILSSKDRELNEYRSDHQHSFPSYDEELPILYRTREGIFTVSGLKDGVFIESEVPSNVFKRYLDRATQEFLRKIKEAFPEIKSPSFKFYTR